MISRIIDKEILNRFSENLKHDNNLKILENAVQKNGIEDVIFSTQDSFKIQEVFNNEIEDLPVMTNQRKSGRCWMFSGLSILSLEIKRNLKIKDIELSESYLMFYDKLEKCNTIFEYVIKNINEPLDSRLFRCILTLSGDNDGNCWHSFVKLVNKYGICPKDVMGETYDSSNSDRMNQILTDVVTRNIHLMRNKNHTVEELYKIKEKALSDIYKILVICIGEPVKEFVFDYELNKEKDNKNTDLTKNENQGCKCNVDLKNNNDNSSSPKEFETIKMTPLEFFNKYSNTKMSDCIQLCNYPGDEYKFMECYCNELNISLIDDSETNYKLLNVDIDAMKNAVIKSIKNNIPVWFGCDVTMDSTRSDGYLSPEVIDVTSVLGIETDYDKTSKIQLFNTEANHAMIFVGVHLDKDGNPIRWKVQNSWGEDNGKKGFFIMTDSWFTKYVYECAVSRKFVTEEIIDAYKKDPIILKPWDPVL